MNEQQIKNWHWYFDELMSEQCQCGQVKRPAFSFCYTCFKRLPRDMQRELYQRIGAGYEEAYEAAVTYLND